MHVSFLEDPFCFPLNIFIQKLLTMFLLVKKFKTRDHAVFCFGIKPILRFVCVSMCVKK